MPHLIVDYSSSLDTQMDMRAVLRRLHDVAITQPTIDPASVKSRLSPRADVLVGQQGDAGRYVHVQFSLLSGRALDVRQGMRDALASVLLSACPTGTDLAVEIREMEKDTYFKDTI